MKFSRRIIKRFIGVKDGFRDGFKDISMWLGSPSMASLGMPSLNFPNVFLGRKGS